MQDIAENLTQEQIDAKLLDEYPLFFLEMNEMQERFIRVKNNHGMTPKRRLDESGNKGGKTWIGISEDLAHSFGKRYWLDEDDPDYKVNIKVPNVGLVGCETMMHSAAEKIWPTFKELIPPTCRYKLKKNPQGQPQKIEFSSDPEGNKCTSEIYIRSYDQEADSYEGIDYGWVHWDEPPPKKILQAAERGKVVTNAPSWFTMTPLKEAYIYDEYSLKAKNNGGDDDEIAVIRGEIWENCIDWCFKCDVDIPENRAVDPLTQKLIRPIRHCPNCGRTMGFITKSGIDEYLKTLDPEEREAREKGIWRHLSGLVYKVLDRDLHVYEDFPMPTNWMKVEGIDPHDARPTCYLFGAVSPEDIEIFGKIRNRIYWFDYLLLKGDLDTIVRHIKVKREHHGYSKPRYVIMDAKYGAREDRQEISWEDAMRDRGLGYIRLSQSKPGDVEIGHKIVRQYLKPHHSTLTNETKPGMMFARDGCGGNGGPIQHLFNYQYKDGKDKPDEQFKDFSDIVRYIALEEPVYINPQEEAKVIDIIQQRRDKIINSRRQFAKIGGR